MQYLKLEEGGWCQCRFFYIDHKSTLLCAFSEKNIAVKTMILQKISLTSATLFQMYLKKHRILANPIFLYTAPPPCPPIPTPLTHCHNICTKFSQYLHPDFHPIYTCNVCRKNLVCLWCLFIFLRGFVTFVRLQSLNI